MCHTLIFTDGSIANNSLLNKKVGIAGFMFTTLTNNDKYIQPWRSEFVVSSKNKLDIHRLELGAVTMAMHCISFYVPHRVSIFTDSDKTYKTLVQGYFGNDGEYKIVASYATQYYQRLIELGFDTNIVLCKSHVSIDKQCDYLTKTGTKPSTWSTAIISAGNSMIDRYVSSIAKYGDLQRLEQYNENDPLRKGCFITA